MGGSRSGGLIFAAFLFLCAVGAAVRFISEENYGVAALCFGGLASVAAFIGWAANRASPEHNPAAKALLEEPESVTLVAHNVSTSSGGGMKLHWLYVVTPKGRVAMQVKRARVRHVARALAKHCPNATIEVPGVERSAVD